MDIQPGPENLKMTVEGLQSIGEGISTKARGERWTRPMQLQALFSNLPTHPGRHIFIGIFCQEDSFY